jgi:endonuclease/exonuclease/phosphatase family metal-dependent hydrolase
MKKILICLLSFLLCFNSALALTGSAEKNEGIHLNYDDLVNLSNTESPEGILKEKLEKQLNSVIIEQPTSNINFLHGMILGDFIRVAQWNIERGFNVDKIEKALLAKDIPGLETGKEVPEEANILSKASIIVLNEVDIGIPRTKYENIAKRLANKLKMGYAFGTEFIEVDPYQLGVKKFSEKERTYLENEALIELDNLDKEKYHGLHGTAILSKYPILSVRVIRLPNVYNWYQQESSKISALEKIKRGAARSIFAEKVLTELRHGGRMAIVADLKLPNNQIITVVATHIENRCIPGKRFEQVNFLLDQIKDIENPLILTGDFNTTGSDASPTSVKKEVLKKVKDKDFLIKQALLAITPFGIVQNLVVNGVNIIRQFKNPTARNIPVILPNKERILFDYIKEFSFVDGKTFDVRGIPEKTHRGNCGLFSNSNERSLKGFKTTFEMQKAFGIAKYKLDWFFVKPLNLKDSNDKEASYAYAPHYGRTLSALNRSFGERISDHDPITVDIPVSEPKEVKL